MTDTDGPSPVLGISDATSVSAGFDATCATLADGTVRCWGTNQWGQLGDGTTTNSSVPLAVPGLTNALSTCTGQAHSCALLDDGTIRCWGANSFGQLGNGTRLDSTVPVAVTGIANATTISCGYDHTCAVLHDGSIQCWGADGGGPENAIGALGNPAVTELCTWVVIKSPPGNPSPSISTETPCAATPVQVSGITNAVTVAAGDYSACAVLTDGSVECWGYNFWGELGDGTTLNSISPVTVMAQSGK